MKETFIDKAPDRARCHGCTPADRDPAAQAIRAVAQGAARASTTTASGVRGQGRASSIRILGTAVLAHTCLMGAVQAAELTAGGPGVAKPKEFQFGEVTVRTKGTMTYGTIIRAGVENSEMVEALGYRIRRLFVGVFVVGSALAGLGGVMWALYRETLTAAIGEASAPSRPSLLA